MAILCLPFQKQYCRILQTHKQLYVIATIRNPSEECIIRYLHTLENCQNPNQEPTSSAPPDSFLVEKILLNLRRDLHYELQKQSFVLELCEVPCLFVDRVEEL